MAPASLPPKEDLPSNDFFYFSQAGTCMISYTNNNMIITQVMLINAFS